MHGSPPRSESLQQVLSRLGTHIVVTRPRCFRSECRRLIAEWRR